MKKLLLIGYLFFLYSVVAYPEGYQVNLQGQRQTGMGHIGTGLSLGASSIHFNPGALSFMDKEWEFSFGGNPIFSNNTFQKPAPSLYEAESDNPIGTPFYFYGAHKVGDKLTLGLGITTPYGNSLEWGDDWDGRYLIQDISFHAIFIQPTASYKITDKLSVGAGFSLVPGSVDLSKALPLTDENGNEGQVELSGTTMGFGFNVGVYFEPSNKFSIGIDYRSQVDMDMEGGDADFTVPSSMQEYFPENNKFSATLPLPANLVIGIGWHPNEKLTLGFDFQYVFWSAYESLDFDFEQNTDLLQDSYNPRNYDNSAVYRIGGEYKLNDKIMLRAGFYYDQTPIPEDYLTPETPGTNKYGMSTGASWKINEKLSLDLSFLYIQGEKREDGYAPADFYGTYYTNAFIPGFGLNYSF
ncbi:MAG: hydrocarbon degradation protein [Chlorobi bacterium]|nr:hydrocarbon degradation protein [Chlorobiota bacterium]